MWAINVGYCKKSGESVETELAHSLNLELKMETI